MKSRRRRSDIMLYSLSEFAFILLFLSIGAGAMIYSRYVAADQRAAEFEQEVHTLSAEVDFLNEILAEKQYGVVPCWRRPDGTIPLVVGTIVIEAPYEYTLTRSVDPMPTALSVGVLEAEQVVEDSLRELFAEDLTYAGAYNCYLRVVVDNRTNSFAHYRNLTSVISRLSRNHMVVVSE